jgi:hypothetical protein
MMFSTLSLMSRMRNWNRQALRPANASPRGLANKLMSTAEARAGRDPRQAEELRAAAQAYLSVVR